MKLGLAGNSGRDVEYLISKSRGRGYPLLHAVSVATVTRGSSCHKVFIYRPEVEAGSMVTSRDPQLAFSQSLQATQSLAHESATIFLRTRLFCLFF